MKLKELTFHAVVGSLWFSSRTRSLLFSLALKKKRWTDCSSYKFMYHLWAMVGVGRTWGKKDLCLQYRELWMTVSLEQSSTKSSSAQEMSFGWVVHTSPGTTTSWSRLMLRGCYHVVTMKAGIILMKSNLSCEALSPRQEFHKPSGGDRMAPMIFGSTHCYKHKAWRVNLRNLALDLRRYKFRSLQVQVICWQKVVSVQELFLGLKLNSSSLSLCLWSRLSCSSTCTTAAGISEPAVDCLGTH